MLKFANRGVVAARIAKDCGAGRRKKKKKFGVVHLPNLE
jgi:hypothetical protein